MKTALLIIGDEILSGDTLDTNSRFAARLLNENGIHVIRRLTVGDREDEIKEALASLLKDADLVISCGGMGPTKDDVTKKSFASYFGSELIWDKNVEEELKSRYAKAGRVLNELTLAQSLVPEKAEVIINPVGTAPVFWFEENGKAVVTLPGVPSEMRYLMSNIILEKIKKRFTTNVICHETIRTVGAAESMIAGKLKDIEEEIEKTSAENTYYKLAYLPELSMVKLRLTGIGKDEKEIMGNISKWKSEIVSIMEEFIYGYGEEELAEAIGKTLRNKHATLGTVESCTGGYIAHLITSIPGSSDYYHGSIISYANEIKTDLLAVNKNTIESFGAVSEETCRELVAGALKQLKTDYVIATTGIAGPSGGTELKPTGTVWIGVGSREGIITKKFLFNRSRTENIQFFGIMGLDMLRRVLK